jgi:hypothetical protein
MVESEGLGKAVLPGRSSQCPGGNLGIAHGYSRSFPAHASINSRQGTTEATLRTRRDFSEYEFNFPRVNSLGYCRLRTDDLFTDIGRFQNHR